MSITICKHCSKHIDTDHDVEHEEMCGEENMNTNQIIKQAQEDFEKKVVGDGNRIVLYNSFLGERDVLYECKEFIAQAITQAVEEEREKVRELIVLTKATDYDKYGEDSAINLKQDLLNHLDKLTK